MASTKIAIGKSYYDIPCTEESKKRLEELAKKLNTMVNRLALQIRNLEDRTLLVIAAITILDELEEMSKVKQAELFAKSSDSTVSAIDSTINNDNNNNDGKHYSEKEMEEKILQTIQTFTTKIEDVLRSCL